MAHSYKAPHMQHKAMAYGVILMSSTPCIANTYEVDRIWQIAIAIRAVYGVNLTAHSYEAVHSKKPLYGVKLMSSTPIANTYEVDLQHPNSKKQVV